METVPTAPTPRTKKYRIVLCGDADTGKTVFLQRIVKHVYDPETFNTIGVDFQTKSVTHRGYTCALQFWDTAGRKTFRDITTSYFLGANAFLLFYDVGSRRTFESLKDWMTLINARTPNPIVFLVGTKVDTPRDISVEEAGTFALKHGAFWADVSSKTGEGIAELETRLLEGLVRKEPTVWEEPSLPLHSSHSSQSTPSRTWMSYVRSWLV